MQLFSDVHLGKGLNGEEADGGCGDKQEKRKERRPALASYLHMLLYLSSGETLEFQHTSFDIEFLYLPA